MILENKDSKLMLWIILKQINKKLHIIGLASSRWWCTCTYENHIIGLVDMYEKKGVEKVYIHAITDESKSTTGGVKYLEETNKKIEEVRREIVTVVGR